VYLVKRRVQIETKPTWAFRRVPKEDGAFWWKQLCSPGQAELPKASWAATTSLFYPTNRGKRVEQKGSALLVLRNLSKLVRKIIFVEKIQAKVLP